MSALVVRFQKLLHIPEFVLISQAKKGDKEAFGKLYENYLDKIYRYVYFKTGQKKELAEDIVSDIFLKVWDNIDSFKKGNFQAWVYAIARNAIIDFYRTKKQYTLLSEEIVDTKQPVEDTLFTKLEMEKVKEALNKLTKPQQEIIILKFIEGYSNKEICKMLKKEEDAIRAMQHRAIGALKELLI